MTAKTKAAAPSKGNGNITAQTLIADVIAMNPAKTTPVFKRHNLYCPTCKARNTESLYFIEQNYGIKLDAFIAEIRKALAGR